MENKQGPALDERVLVLAPAGRDGFLTRSVLTKVGITAEICHDTSGLLAQLIRGAATAVLAQEALNPAAVEHLTRWVREQPPWSDFPFIIIANAEQSAASSAYRLRQLQPLGNLTLFERPFHIETLQTAVQTAVRSRHRQYEARAFLAERQEREKAVRELNATLEQKVIERTQQLAESSRALNQAQRLEAFLAGLRTERLVDVPLHLTLEDCQRVAVRLEDGQCRMHRPRIVFVAAPRRIEREPADAELREVRVDRGRQF